MKGLLIVTLLLPALDSSGEARQNPESDAEKLLAKSESLMKDTPMLSFISTVDAKVKGNGFENGEAQVFRAELRLWMSGKDKARLDLRVTDRKGSLLRRLGDKVPEDSVEAHLLWNGERLFLWKEHEKPIEVDKPRSPRETLPRLLARGGFQRILLRYYPRDDDALSELLKVMGRLREDDRRISLSQFSEVRTDQEDKARWFSFVLDDGQVYSRDTKEVGLPPWHIEVRLENADASPSKAVISSDLLGNRLISTEECQFHQLSQVDSSVFTLPEK